MRARDTVHHHWLKGASICGAEKLITKFENIRPNPDNGLKAIMVNDAKQNE